MVPMLLDNIDISDPAAIHNGGLHVIVMEQNGILRITTQAQARAGRQWNPGSSSLYMCLDDPVFSHLTPEERQSLVLIVTDDPADVANNQCVRELVDTALERAGEETYRQISETNFYADTSRGFEEAYFGLFGQIQRGNVMVRALIDRSVSTWFETLGVRAGQRLTQEQRTRLENWVRERTGADRVDLSELDGMECTEAMERLTESIDGVFERRFGRNAGFHDAATKFGAVGLWTAKMQQLFMLNYEVYNVRYRLIVDEMNRTLVPGDEVSAERARATFEQKEREAAQWLINKVIDDVYKAIFPNAGARKRWERVYNYLEGIRDGGLRGALSLNIVIRGNGQSAAEAEAVVPSEALRIAAAPTDEDLRLMLRDFSAEYEGPDTDPDDATTSPPDLGGQGGPIDEASLQKIKDHSRDMTDPEKTAFETALKGLRDRGLLDANTEAAIREQSGGLKVKVVDHSVWWRAGGDAVFERGQDGKYTLYLRADVLRKGSFVGALLNGGRSLRAALLHEGTEINLRMSFDDMTDIDMHDISTQVELAYKSRAAKPALPATPIKVGPGGVTPAGEGRTADFAQVQRTAEITDPSKVPADPNVTYRCVATQEGEVYRVVGDDTSSTLTLVREEGLPKGLDVTYDAKTKTLVMNFGEGARPADLFRKNGTWYVKSGDKIFEFIPVQGEEAGKLADITSVKMQLASEVKGVAGATLTFVLISTAINLIYRALDRNPNKEPISAISVAKDLGGEIKGFMIFTAQSKVVEFTNISQAGAGTFVFAYSGFHNIGDAKGALEFTCSFAGFEGTMLAFKLVGPLAKLNPLIALAAALAISKGGEYVGRYLAGKHEWIWNNPLMQALANAAEMDRRFNPASRLGDMAADALLPLNWQPEEGNKEDEQLYRDVLAARQVIQTAVSVVGTAAETAPVLEGIGALNALTGAPKGPFAIRGVSGSAATVYLFLLWVGANLYVIGDEQNKMLDDLLAQSEIDDKQDRFAAHYMADNGWVASVVNERRLLDSDYEKPYQGVSDSSGAYSQENVNDVFRWLQYSKPLYSTTPTIEPSKLLGVFEVYTVTGYERLSGQLQMIDQSYKRMMENIDSTIGQWKVDWAKQGHPVSANWKFTRDIRKALKLDELIRKHAMPKDSALWFSNENLSREQVMDIITATYLNANVPNWMYLLYLDPKVPQKYRGRNRTIFSMELKNLLGSHIVWKYMGMMDRKEIIPIPLHSLYSSLTKPQRSAQGGLTGRLANRDGTPLIQPGEYWARTGTNPFVTAAEDAKIKRERNAFLDYIIKYTQHEKEYVGIYKGRPIAQLVRDYKAGKIVLDKTVIERYRLIAKRNADRKSIASIDKSLPNIATNISHLQNGLESIKRTYPQIQKALMNLAQDLSRMGVDIRRVERTGTTASGATAKYRDIEIYIDHKLVYQQGKIVQGLPAESAQILCRLSMNTLMPMLDVLKWMGAAGNDQNLQFGRVDKADVIKIFGSDNSWQKYFENPKDGMLVCKQDFVAMVKASNMTEAQKEKLISLFSYATDPVENKVAFGRDFGVVLEVLGTLWKGQVNSINAETLSGAQANTALKSADMLSGLRVPLPLSQVEIKKADGIIKVFVDGKEMDQTTEQGKRNIQLIQMFIQGLLRKNGINSSGDFAKDAATWLNGSDIGTLKNMPNDNGLLVPFKEKPAKVEMIRSRDSRGVATFKINVTVMNGNEKAIRSLDPAKEEDRAILLSLNNDVLVPLLKQSGKQVKPMSNFDPKQMETNMGTLMNIIEEQRGSKCNQLNSKILEDWASILAASGKTLASFALGYKEGTEANLKQELQEQIASQENAKASRAKLAADIVAINGKLHRQ